MEVEGACRTRPGTTMMKKENLYYHGDDAGKARGKDVGRRKCVLIVDDDESVLFVLNAALQRLAHFCQVHVASSGAKALALIQETPFDLIITDLFMPGINGQELTAKIRQTSPDTIVIWITAHRSANTDEEARLFAVYRCLEKPVSVAQIRTIVPEALGITARPH